MILVGRGVEISFHFAAGKYYPEVSLWLIHSKHRCLSFLQTIVFQVKQNENKHGLTIFKHLVFVYSGGVYALCRLWYTE